MVTLSYKELKAVTKSEKLKAIKECLKINY